MQIEVKRKIRDSLHGSMSLTPLEDAVMSHPYFQRLRRIKQTAFLNLVFPCASHSRFEHSLGVLHLSGKAWLSLCENQKRLAARYEKDKALQTYENELKQQIHSKEPEKSMALLRNTFPRITRIFEDPRILQALRLAAMLHDVGHPPFSHSGERFLPSWFDVYQANKNWIPDYLDKFFLESMQNLKSQKKDPHKLQVRHEIFSVLITEKILQDVLNHHPELDCGVNSRDVAAILSKDIEVSKNSALYKDETHKLLREIISGEFDVDRVDYLMRDSKECGVVYGLFDIDRIFDSLCLYEDAKTSEMHLGVHLSGLSALEDYLRARQSMYLQVYFHKSGVAVEAMLQDLATRMKTWKLPAKVEEFVKFDDQSIYFKLKEDIQQSSIDRREKELCIELLEGALLDRKLWKRVFEIVTNSKNSQSLSEEAFEKAKHTLDNLGLRYEEVSSKFSLVRFKPEKTQSPSLMVLHKNPSLIPVFSPITDMVDSLKIENRTQIRRIYVESGVGKDGIPLPVLAKQAIQKALHVSKPRNEDISDEKENHEKSRKKSFQSKKQDTQKSSKKSNK